MADEIVNPEPEKEESLEDAFASEGDLAKLFSEASSNPGEEELEKEEKPTEEKPAQVEVQASDDPRIAQLIGESQQIRERLAASEARNNLLQTQLRDLGKTEKEEAKEFTFEDFRKMVAEDPASAIYKLFEQTKSNAAGIGQNAIEQAKAEARSTLERQSSYESDRATLVSEYGELLNTNKDFARLAEQIYNRTVSNSPVVMQDPNTGQDVRWHPGAMYSAASMAYAQLHRAGQLQINNPKNLTLVPKKTKPANPLNGEQTSDVPRTIASDISAKDLAIMKITARRLGMPLEKYLKTFEEQKERNPYYGTGA
jgi:hypothetical protein